MRAKKTKMRDRIDVEVELEMSIHEYTQQLKLLEFQTKTNDGKPDWHHRHLGSTLNNLMFLHNKMMHLEWVLNKHLYCR